MPSGIGSHSGGNFRNISQIDLYRKFRKRFMRFLRISADALGNFRTDRFVVVEFHAERTATLRG